MEVKAFRIIIEDNYGLDDLKLSSILFYRLRIAGDYKKFETDEE